MKTVKAYHGTSAESYKSILENGFNSSLSSVSTWDCSNDEYIYLWCPQTFIEHNESDDIEEAVNRCIEEAFSSAKITASIQKSKSDSVYVFELEINEEDLESDDSCENMDLANSVHSSKKITIKKVYRGDFAYNASLLYIANLIDSDYLNLSNFSNAELSIMGMFSKVEVPEEFLYTEYEEV